MIYFDNNASSPIYPEVIDEMVYAFKNNANSNSVHFHGRKIRKSLENAREEIARFVNANSTDLVFVGSGTQANNLAILGGREKKIIACSTDHLSITSVYKRTKFVNVDNNGIINLKELESELKNSKPGEVVVAVSYANSETGILQPISKISKICAKYMQRLHVDCIQALGKMEINFNILGANSISISAHKIGGPQGIGALIYNKNLGLKPIVRGGGQEESQHAGTVFVAGAVGFSKAIEILNKKDEYFKNMKALSSYLEKKLKKNIKDLIIVGEDVKRIGNTTGVILPNLSSDLQIMMLDIEGISVSSGSACSSGAIGYNKVIKAMGYGFEHYNNFIRISLGWKNTKKEVDEFINKYTVIVNNR